MPRGEVICEACGQYESECRCNKIEWLVPIESKCRCGDKEVTQQNELDKVREQIADIVAAGEGRLPTETSDQILALIQQPEVLKELGLVRLDEDQTLPPTPLPNDSATHQPTLNEWYRCAQSDMFHAGWRKVILK